jgi:hypothetical protein
LEKQWTAEVEVEAKVRRSELPLMNLCTPRGKKQGCDQEQEWEREQAVV